MKREKPPSGVMPEKFWKEDRLKALDDAIAVRICTQRDIPLEWPIERIGY